MGGHFCSLIQAWTFIFYFIVPLVGGDRGLVQDLGLDSLPDVTKINISQIEYTTMMDAYLQLQGSSSDANAVSKLLTFTPDRKYWRRRRDDAVKLRFPVEFFDRGVQVENAELRLLAPPLPGQEVHAVKISQVLGARRRRVLQERTVYLSLSLSKWLEFDVTEAVKDWLKGERNLGIELECPACLDVWQPLEAYLNVLVRPESNRAKRSAGREEGRTDCRGNGKQKPRCCRHKMPVVFQELDMPEMQYIVQPKVYEAGFCKGRCPPNYNHATNHSRIQSMVHKLNNKTPKVCCAPSKLESLEILRVHPHNAGKLVIETWDNMKVLECACS